jgi:hypothetical protein
MMSVLEKAEMLYKLERGMRICVIGCYCGVNKSTIFFFSRKMKAESGKAGNCNTERSVSQWCCGEGEGHAFM